MKPRWFHESRADRVFATHYPFGVAQRAIGRNVVKQTAQKVSDQINSSQANSGPVLFVVSYSDDDKSGLSDSFSGAQGELLAKAITQGLKWDLKSTKIYFVLQRRNDLSPPKNSDQAVISQSSLKNAIEEMKPSAVVALGAEAMSALGLASVENVRAPVRSRWIEHTHCQALCTHDLREVLRDSDIKKAFWQDLKFLGEKIPL